MTAKRPRAAGVLLHVTSLPGPFGIGDLGPGAELFLDWSRDAGFSLWQFLPLGPTSEGNSPYGGSSAFAGNPLLLSPELLVRDGLLSKDALSPAPYSARDKVDFGALVPWKDRLLQASWDHVRRAGITWVRDDLRAFVASSEQAAWLADWSLFAALKERFRGASWHDWPRELARREPAALASARHELADSIEFQNYLQFLFDRQWRRLRGEARARRITLFGDAPIYVAPDSADVWAHPWLFQLDDNLQATAVSGVPPDYFSDTGQLWGTPLYAWDRHRQDGFTWWIERVRANLRACDLLRIDHFRAFAAYWSVPAGSRTAEGGSWIPAPGAELFDALRHALGRLPIVAEDLGLITDDVRALLARVGFPGMKVLQFAFEGPDNDHLPHRHSPDSVVYTGTHDNNTVAGWFAALDPGLRSRVLDYVGGNGEQIHWNLIRAALTSVADRAVIPMQDILGLGTEARMNEPALADGNWGWRVTDAQLDSRTAARMRKLIEWTGRLAGLGSGEPG